MWGAASHPEQPSLTLIMQLVHLARRFYELFLYAKVKCSRFDDKRDKKEAITWNVEQRDAGVSQSAEV